MRFFRLFRFHLIHSPSRVVTGLLLGLCCALAIQAIIALQWLDSVERGAQDFLFYSRQQRFGSPKIALVVADNETVARYKTWPLPRRIYAQTVDVLHKAGARTVAFDILFSESSPSPADDAALVRACRKAGNVVQACAFHIENRYNPELPVNATGLSSAFASQFVLNGGQPANRTYVPSAVWVSAAMPALRNSAPLLGHINVHPDRDGTLRSVPHAISYRKKLYPSLALSAAAHFLGVKTRDIKISGQEIQFAGRRLPINYDGETLINWCGGNRTFPTYSLDQVLDGQVDKEAFAGKIVLVGVTAAGSFEARATPFSSVQPALELQANALDNILLNRPLRTTTFWPQFLLLLVVSLISGGIIASRAGLSGILMLSTFLAALWIAALWLLSAHSFYLPVAAPLISAVLTYSLAVAVNYRAEWEANFRTDAAVSALARGGALMAAGQTQARLQMVVRAAARDALQAEEIFLVQLTKGGNEEQDELLVSIAETLQNRRRAVLFPNPRRVRRMEQPFVPDADLKKQLMALAQRYDKKPSTIVAAPLLQSRGASTTEAQTALDFNSALIAVGSRENRNFGFRDAVMLEAVAKQAGLAIENLEYAELLQGRIELANRDLRDAYIVLAEQSSKFMAAVESIDDALIICDPSGKALYVNVGAAPTLREATPLLGFSVPEQLRKEHLDSIASMFDCLTLRGSSLQAEPARCEELWQRDENDDEQQRVLSAQLTPLFADGDRLIGAMLLVSDITTQRELDQMKTDFVSFVAHELRSPLSTILGYATLMEQYGEQSDLQTRNEMASAITRQCHRLNRLIGDLLDISRLEAGHTLELRRERVELRGLTEKVLDAQRAALANPKITLEMECDETAVTVWGDPDRLEQVLVNLISNAIKYSPEGGKIVTQISEGGNHVAISVRDQGMGMSQDQIDSLFQKFYRTPEVRARGIKGTGLGLFLVKNLVEAHRGTISVESETGAGTTFHISLPRRSGEQSATGSMLDFNDEIPPVEATI